MLGGCRRVVSALVATAAIGLAATLLFGPVVLNYDAAWSLVWTRDLLVGAHDAEGSAVGPMRPLSGTFSRPLVPTPHPLTDVVSGLLAPVSLHAPTVSEQILLILALAAFGALGVVTYVLGARLGARLVGVLAAAMLLTREPVLGYGLRAYLDIPYTVLLLGAGLSALSGRTAATRTMVLLTFAGLLRPEAWAVGWRLLVVPRLDQSSHRSPARPSGGRVRRCSTGVARDGLVDRRRRAPCPWSHDGDRRDPSTPDWTAERLGMDPPANRRDRPRRRVHRGDRRPDDRRADVALPPGANGLASWADEGRR